MDRTGLVILMAAILFAAFAFGWFAHWLALRFFRAGGPGTEETARMARALQEAEAGRDAATADLKRHEASAASLLNQAVAEREAAMDGLRNARREAEELRVHIERLEQG